MRGKDSSPVLWTHNDKTYVICNGQKELVCVDFATGKTVWSVSGPGGPGTPVVSENHLAILGNKPETGLMAYEISAGEAKPLWQIDKIESQGSSVILHEDHVYAVTKTQVLCTNIETGKRAWTERPGPGGISSPVLIGDRILSILKGGRQMMLIDASPTFKLHSQVRFDGSPCASPAISKGRLYVRTLEGVACHSLDGQ